MITHQHTHVQVLEGIALNLNPTIQLCDDAIPVLLKAQAINAKSQIREQMGLRP